MINQLNLKDKYYEEILVHDKSDVINIHRRKKVKTDDNNRQSGLMIDFNTNIPHGAETGTDTTISEDIMFDNAYYKASLDRIFESIMNDSLLIFEDTLDEVSMKRVVRRGKIVKKVKVKKKGFKVLRQGNKVKFVRMTQKEKRLRRKSARMAWRVGKGARKNKTKRSMIKSKVRMRSLYGK